MLYLQVPRIPIQPSNLQGPRSSLWDHRERSLVRTYPPSIDTNVSRVCVVGFSYIAIIFGRRRSWRTFQSFIWEWVSFWSSLEPDHGNRGRLQLWELGYAAAWGSSHGRYNYNICLSVILWARTRLPHYCISDFILCSWVWRAEHPTHVAIWISNNGFFPRKSFMLSFAHTIQI